ncbi:hypothetical protein RhiirA5_437010 [Rhizophagus irregularis]|uniref:Uncharacterized protein n=1 Tax=Rhizophagus irregularis TaxID=588596 RepID=A0A2N0R0G5_9GLOM|nr:hypothetical protein RhiirA5_437010 [Rhizophagus irregularis]PKC56806.1 hypothetical protein RhiirA1_473460 [Rhizophagus irregularis]GET59411.1 hypothetical protein RIR_e67821_A0A2N0R0G5_9GLOM [Rhizophagus irregularis DAOM 181602=DAOM 197198]
MSLKFLLNNILKGTFSGEDDSLRILLMLWILGFFKDPNTKKLTDDGSIFW